MTNRKHVSDTSQFVLMIDKAMFDIFKLRSERLNKTPNEMTATLIKESNMKRIRFEPMGWFAQSVLNMCVFLRTKAERYIFIFKLDTRDLSRIRAWGRTNKVQVREMMLQLISAFNDDRVLLTPENPSTDHFSVHFQK